MINNVSMMSQIRMASGGENGPLHVATGRYRDALTRAWLARVRSLLTGRPRRLLSLDEMRRGRAVRERHYAGLQQVPLSRICGSEGRHDDFDADMNPIKGHNKARWLRVAVARLSDVPLPPVSLIQVGDLYLVRDGHHRVSVAHAWGQESIEAEVTVWDLAPLPATARQLAHAL